MTGRPSNRPWWYGDDLPWPVLLLLSPLYILAMAVLAPIVMIGMLFGLHLPKDKNGKRVFGDHPTVRTEEPSWMGRDPGPDV